MNNQKENVIIGLGNTIRGDDGIGIYITGFLSKKFKDLVDVVSTEEMGLSLLDFLSPYKKAVIIDSIYTGKQDTGNIYVFNGKNINDSELKSNHYIGIPELIHVARKLRLPFPKEILIIGISVEDPFTIRPTISEDLKNKIPEILNKIEKIIKKFFKIEI
ncbi:MAG: hydrogenase maturation protease [Candidatus Hydrothermales bacterium]